MDVATYCPCCGHDLTELSAACPTCGCPAAARGAPDGRLLRNDELRLLQRLGDGGTANLYLAKSITGGPICVVKEFRPPTEWQARSLFEAMFHDEARLLARLHKEHPAIPRFYDSFIDRGTFYITLEFIPGQNLDSYLAKQVGRMPPGEVVDYIRQVVAVLVVIHNLLPRPVIHGDIKPSNLIRRPEGRVALIDFGLAQMSGGRPSFLAGRSSAFGTPGYTPLEQWEGQISPASDIFALGATMHHLLTGRNPAAPFARQKQVSLVELSALTTFPPLTALVPDAPHDLDRLVAQMLHRRPTERPTARELQLRLARFDTTAATI